MNVGIDLGTTYSLASIAVAGRPPVLVPDCDDRQVLHTPSVVCITGRHALVGREAEKAFDHDPNLTLIRFFKRDLGNAKPIWQDPEGTPWYAETIAALVLKKLRIDAEVFAADKVKGAVVTVPAHFVHSQRNAVLAAAMMADLPIVDLLDEPVAAALHYGILPSSSLRDRPVFVYDFGGGTFDATVLRFTPEVEVKAKLGKTRLGGKDIDDKVSEMILSQFERALNAPVDLTARTLLDLRRAAEDIKIEICMPAKPYVQRTISLCGRGAEITIRRSEFDSAVSDLVDETISASVQCVSEAGITPAEVGVVLLVGGSSWVPRVRERVGQVFCRPHQKILFHEPTKAVAIGAGLRLAQIEGSAPLLGLSPELKGVTGYCVGVRALDATTGEIVIDTIIKRNQSLPARAVKRYFTSRPDQTRMKFEIVEYHDNLASASKVGELVVGPLANPREDYPIDVNVEYRSDGILTVKACDPSTGAALSQEFGTAAPEAARFLRQRTMFRSTAINNI